MLRYLTSHVDPTLGKAIVGNIGTYLGVTISLSTSIQVLQFIAIGFGMVSTYYTICVARKKLNQHDQDKPPKPE